jgi:hypothetical protein
MQPERTTQPDGERSLLRNQRGAVFVEHLIVFVPTMFLFLATLQTILLCTGNLVIKRAASAAARAAVVILPADPRKYGGAPQHAFTGARAAAVVRASKMILTADPHFDLGSVDVSVSGASGAGPLTATVRAQYQCFARFVNVVCAGSSRQLKGTSIQAYQGADYAYE